jgi:hypothetical protein
MMSDTANENIYYDSIEDKFKRPAHAKFHALFKEYSHPPLELIQQLSEETGAPLSKCQVCNSLY